MGDWGRILLGTSLFFLLFGVAGAGDPRSVPPLPARVGGTVVVNGIALSPSTDEGYIFEIRRENGSPYTPPAVDDDGLNEAGFYSINIPIHDASLQPGGAMPDENAVMIVRNGERELTVHVPPGGVITIGQSGQISRVDLECSLEGEPSRKGRMPWLGILLADG